MRFFTRHQVISTHSNLFDTLFHDLFHALFSLFTHAYTPLSPRPINQKRKRLQ